MSDKESLYQLYFSLHFFSTSVKAEMRKAMAQRNRPLFDVLNDMQHAITLLMVHNPFVVKISSGGDPGIIPTGAQFPEIYNRSLHEEVRPLIAMLNPETTPEAWYRAGAIQNMMLVLIHHKQTLIPENVLAAFDHTAATDPDPAVRAWARFARSPWGQEPPDMPPLPPSWETLA